MLFVTSVLNMFMMKDYILKARITVLIHSSLGHVVEVF